MIDHSKCDHPSTSGARAKCRRAAGGGEPRQHKEATEKDVDFAAGAKSNQRTPRDAFNECHVCGVERIEFRGVDAFTGLHVLVGERCAWRVKRSDEFQALP